MEGKTRNPSPAEEYERALVPAMFVPCTRLLLHRAPPRPGERVLDLACGSGIVARAVAEIVGASGVVVGVDHMPGMLAVARALPPVKGAPIEWREGKADALDIENGVFDLVLCQQGLQFFPDRAAALREAKRVLREGGRAGFAMWRGREAQPVFDLMCEVELRNLGTLGVTREDVEIFLSLGDAGEIRRLFDEAGFRHIEITADSIEADFDAASFVRDAEFAYSAFMPQFRENPAAFSAYLDAVTMEMEPVLARYRVGDRLRFPVPVHIATAVA